MGRVSSDIDAGKTSALAQKDASVQATIQEFMDDVLPFAQDYAQAVETLDDLPCENRARAVLAVKMMADAALDRAAQLSEGMRAIAEGRHSAADYGFPEFDDDADQERVV